jgi:UDP-galactopyranose mutase
MTPHARDARLTSVPVPVPHAVEPPDVICLSHLRWDFVFQRPQHLLTRCARNHRVFFVEEPVRDSGIPRMQLHTRQNAVRVAVPHLPPGLSHEEYETLQEGLLDQLLIDHGIDEYVLWYYTPMAVGFSRHLSPCATVYDCMDELSGFAGAPPGLREREAELLLRADLVTTGGQTLYESKRHLHPNVHPFPSSVDVEHFALARNPQPDPADQQGIPHPRLGFFGVIDERMDLDLLRGVAAARPDWHLVILGPVVKISESQLPRAANIHYLGGKSYDELPAYIAGWDVALLPFAHNDATRFISPTKTPEYLAAGRPVVSTSIRDVVRPYGARGLVRIADRADEFINAIDAALQDTRPERLLEVDAFLAQTSWDGTWTRMYHLLKLAMDARRAAEEHDTAASAGGSGIA